MTFKKNIIILMALDHKNEKFENYCYNKFNVNVMHILFFILFRLCISMNFYYI